MRQFLLMTAFVLSSVMLFGQYMVKGSVSDENGNPLEGASVVLEGQSQGKITGSDGSFYFDKLEKRNYTLIAYFLGYETVRKEVEAGKDVKIVMPRKAYNLDEVTVTSLRANDRSAVAYSNVTAEELSQRNLGQDMPYLLSLTPSFVATSDAGTGIGYTGFRIRGTDANRINVTVNGVPYNDAESQGSFFVNMPDFASSLSSVQVQRGVGSSTNGAAAFGASINMQTDNLNTKPYAELSGSYGSFNTSKYTVKAGSGLIKDHFAFDGRISGINSDGYIDRASVDLKSYFFSAGYYGEKTVLKLMTFGGKEKTYQAWNGISEDKLNDPVNYSRTYNEIGKYIDDEGNTKYYDNQTDNYTQIHYQLHWMQKLAERLDLSVALHYTDGVGYYEDYKTGRNYVEYGLEPAEVGGVLLKKTDLVRQKWLENDFYGFTFALNYNRNRMNLSLGGGANRYDCDHIGKIIWVRYPNNFDPDRDWYRGNSVKDDMNIYTKLNAELITNLFLTADVQFRYVNYKLKGQDDKYDYVTGTMRDITQKHDFPFFNPKVGLTYKLNKQNDFYASFSVANREPNRNNYTDAGANERPRSERLYDTEFGYRFQSQAFTAGVNAYYMRYKDQLILTGKISEIGEALTTNIPESYRMGVELMAGWKLSKHFRWDGNLTLSENKIIDFTEEVAVRNDDYDIVELVKNEYKSTTIAYSPSVIGNSILTFNYNNVEIGVTSSYVGRQYLDNTSSEDRSLDPYFVNNLSVKYSLSPKWIKGIDLQLLINNIFNEEYESNGYTFSEYYEGDTTRYDYNYYFPQAKANFLASVTFRF